jgi:Sterile alpha motif (SAM)/Pointed domain
MCVAFKMQSDVSEKCENDASVEIVIDDSRSDENDCEKNDDDVESSSNVADEEIIYVPDNPTMWSEKDIEKWIKWATNAFNISPPLDATRFCKSGLELAKFSKADFYIMSGSFENGKKVADHFKYLMDNVSEKVDASLLNDEVPGKLVNFFYFTSIDKNSCAAHLKDTHSSLLKK